MNNRNKYILKSYLSASIILLIIFVLTYVCKYIFTQSVYLGWLFFLVSFWATIFISIYIRESNFRFHVTEEPMDISKHED